MIQGCHSFLSEVVRLYPLESPKDMKVIGCTTKRVMNIFKKVNIDVVCRLELAVSCASMELSLVKSHSSRKQVVALRGMLDILVIMGVK